MKFKKITFEEKLEEIKKIKKGWMIITYIAFGSCASFGGMLFTSLINRPITTPALFTMTLIFFTIYIYGFDKKDVWC